MMAAAAEDQTNGSGRETAGPHPRGERHTPDGDPLAALRAVAKANGSDRAADSTAA